MADALQVKGLKKSYGNIPVLKGIDFSVQQGEIFALLGVNGAGKTEHGDVESTWNIRDF